MHVSRLACLLLAVIAGPSASAEIKFAAFFSVAFHCGAPSAGAVELISENRFGARERVRIWYKDDDAVKISVGAADKGKPFEDTVLPDIEDAGSPAVERTIIGLTQTMEPFHQACLGDAAARRQVEKLVNQGRADLARDK